MISSGLSSKKICHADSLAETFDAADQDSKKHIVYCLPFIMIEPDKEMIEDGARAIAIEALQ
jgi:hypothetical protein